MPGTLQHSRLSRSRGRWHPESATEPDLGRHLNQQSPVGQRPTPPAHRTCPRSPTGPRSRPNRTNTGLGRRRTPGKATRSPQPGGAWPWWRWMPAPRSSVQAGRSPARCFRQGPAAHRLLLHVESGLSGRRAVRRLYVERHPGHRAFLPAFPRYHVRGLLPGPYLESIRYRDFMGWNIPWCSAQDSLSTLLAGRRGTKPTMRDPQAGHGFLARDAVNIYRFIEAKRGGKRNAWRGRALPCSRLSLTGAARRHRVGQVASQIGSLAR
jgi:hypothetical protein